METVSSAVTLRYLAGCAPVSVDRMTLEALGHFPTSSENVVTFDARGGETALSALPVAAQLYRVRVQTAESAFAAIARSGEAGARFDALVLPLGAECALPTPGLVALAERAVIALSGGDLLLAGGVDEAAGKLAQRTAYRVRVARGELELTPQGMFLPRALAAAVRVDGEGWVVGGAQSVLAGSMALDTFERYDEASGSFRTLGRLAAARARAAALRLSDGSVLVAGGEESVDGRKLDTLERIASDGSRSELLAARMPWPAASVSLLQRDDGLVWVSGRVADEMVLALFDPASEAFAELPVPGPALGSSPIVALPGARAALIEVASGETTGVLHLLLPNGESLRLAQWLTPFAGLSQPVAHASSEGRIWLAGRRGQDWVLRILDVGRQQVSARSLAAALSTFVPLADGSVAELFAHDVRVRREDARTPFDNPGGTLLADDVEQLALDAHTRWQREGLVLVAKEGGARFDLAGLVYENVVIELALAGEGELLLRAADGHERALSVDTESVGPALCTLPRAPGQPLLFTRRAESIHMRSGAAERTCQLQGMRGPVALAFRALSAGARVERLTVTRE